MGSGCARGPRHEQKAPLLASAPNLEPPDAEEVPKAAPSSSGQFKVVYVSDVEGHWEYFCNFVDICEMHLEAPLRFQELGNHRNTGKVPTLILADGWHFVFGGDTCDKGPGTLRFVECLVRLKRAYPGRVHLLLGNRDINKMRWTSELHQSEIDRMADVPSVFWVPKEAQIRPMLFLRRLAAEAERIAEAEVTEEMAMRYSTKANKLRYMLKHDMGSDGDFDFRRQELALMRGRSEESVSDEEVVKSYEDFVSEGELGWMREYLEHGKLAVLLGGTLFVHGQIIGNQFSCCLDGKEQWSICVVPGQDGKAVDIHEWVDKLNAWGNSQVLEWERAPTWSVPPTEATHESWAGRGGADLLVYGTPSSRLPSVVYCRYLDHACMPQQYPKELVEHLAGQGVKRVLVGHTPHGNCPTVIPHGGVTVLMSDTSYSDMKADKERGAYVGDNRGDAVSAIFVEGDLVKVKGRTQKRQIVDYKVNCGTGDRYVGQMQADPIPEKERYFVKAKLYDKDKLAESTYLMCRVQGFKVDYINLSGEEVARTLGGETFVKNDSASCVLTSTGDMFGHDFGEGRRNTCLLDYIWQQLDMDNDGRVCSKELLTACTQHHIRDALRLAFPGASIEEMLRKLNESGRQRLQPSEFIQHYCNGLGECFFMKRSFASALIASGSRTIHFAAHLTREFASRTVDFVTETLSPAMGSSAAVEHPAERAKAKGSAT